MEKKKKLDALELSEEEWACVGLFCNLLGVSLFQYISAYTLLIVSHVVQYADEAQQAFSADKYPTLYNALPAIEKMYSSWEKASKKWKYEAFAPALEEGMSKLNDYYEKTAASDSHIMAMRMFIHIYSILPIVLTCDNLQSFIPSRNWLISRRIGMLFSL